MGVGRLVERVVPQQRLRVADGLGVVATAFVQRRGLLQRVANRLRQPIALGQQPIAVAAGQQVAPIVRNRLLQVQHLVVDACGRPCLFQVRLEFGHIQPEGRVAAPLHGELVGSQKAIGVRQGPAQAVPQSAQIGAGLLLGGVGPEEEGQVLARDRPLAVQQQIGEQLLQARD